MNNQRHGRYLGRVSLRGTILTLAGLLIAFSVVAPLLPLPDPNAVNLSDRLLAPFTAGHLLGTDLLGRDVFARLLAGTRLSVMVALAAALASALVGSTIGIVAAYFGGWYDHLLMRGIDLLLAFPYLVLALALVAVLGPSLFNALLAIAIVNVPFFARTVRGVALGLARRPFTEAARVLGQPNRQVIFRHLLPNLLPTILVTTTTTLGWMLLETAGLSFLGLGAQPPQADLGSMLAEGRKLMLVHPHVALLPGLVILLLAIAFNLAGDILRERLDPKRG